MTTEQWERCTPRELTSLMEARAKLEEAKEQRADLRAGLVAAVLRNLHRRKETDPVWQAGDFFQHQQQAEVLTPEEMQERMITWAEAHNRRVAEA